MKLSHVWFAAMVGLALAAPAANDLSSEPNSIGSDDGLDDEDLLSGKGLKGGEDPRMATDRKNRKVCEDCNCWLNAFLLPVPGPGRCPAGMCPYKCSRESLSKGLASGGHNIGDDED
ncbi:hypothetical protein NLG97_g4327 [Lecanicillium saksenae]|uniref:Uncharacterized protein n=1 Tax=Lecanicillium saksenae TaxID=468837 RepID=A0ACC1QVM8_9HYPO|nr:hypothetical protein NLG97_g4327 [Lecanicillium saksenae]